MHQAQHPQFDPSTLRIAVFSNRAIQPAQIVTQTTVVSGSRTCCRCNKRMPEHLPGCYKLVTAQDVVPRSVQPRIILNVGSITCNDRLGTRRMPRRRVIVEGLVARHNSHDACTDSGGGSGRNREREVKPRVQQDLTKNVRRATEDKLIMYTCQCETWIQAQVP